MVSLRRLHQKQYQNIMTSLTFLPLGRLQRFLKDSLGRRCSSQLDNHFFMSLPQIASLADCTDFSKTVSPYVPQLYDLPQQVLQSISDPQALQQVYLATNPLISALAFSLFLTPVVLIVSEINKNYSQVDRLWSILPTLYNAHFVIYAHLMGLPCGRLDILLFFSFIWSVRLHILCLVLELKPSGSIDI